MIRLLVILSDTQKKKRYFWYFFCCLPFCKPEDIKISSYISLPNVPSNDKVDFVASIEMFLIVHL